MNNPTPEQIKQARKEAGLTQKQAAAILYKSLRAWQQWEGGQRNMSQSDFELFNLKKRTK